MLHRSVPMYQECQDLTVHWCIQFTKPSTSIYDLGCSTGTLILKLVKNLEASANIKLIGIDNSEAMLKKAKENLKKPKLQKHQVLPWIAYPYFAQHRNSAQQRKKLGMQKTV